MSHADVDRNRWTDPDVIRWARLGAHLFVKRDEFGIDAEEAALLGTDEERDSLYTSHHREEIHRRADAQDRAAEARRRRAAHIEGLVDRYITDRKVDEPTARAKLKAALRQ